MNRLHAIRRSKRSALYTDPAERRWAIYGRWLAWFGRRNSVRALAALAAVVVFALLNCPDVGVCDIGDLFWGDEPRDWPET